MLGNVQGWLISLLIVIAMTAGLIYVGQLDRVTPPTALTEDARNLAPFNWTIPPLDQLGGVAPRNDESPDAAARDYAAAISAYQENSATYDQIAAGNLPDNFEQLPAIAALLRATQCNEAVELLRPMASDVVTFKASRPPLDAIGVLGNVLISAGMLADEVDPSASRRYYSAAFTLGRAMVRERLVYAEMSVGAGLMTGAVTRFAKRAANDLAAGAAIIDAIGRFDADRRALQQSRITPVWQTIATVDPGIVSEHAGDVFVFARRSEERLWRVEACMALGRFKYAAPRSRDRAAAGRLLSQLVAAPGEDPIVKLAAAEAQKLTVEDYRTLR